MEFGKGVLNALPADYSQAEMEDAMLTIITVKCHCIGHLAQHRQNEKMVLDALLKRLKDNFK